MREMVTNRLLIDIELPSDNWASNFTVCNPDIFITVEEHMFIESEKLALRISIQGNDAILAFEELQQSNLALITSIHEQTNRYIEASIVVEGDCILYKSLRNSGQILHTPYTIKQGHTTWAFITDQKGALSTKNAFSRSDLNFEIIAFGAYRDARLLTPKQRVVFDAAVFGGYYDKPRKITLTDLAKDIGMSKSSLCEMLHLIEKNIMHNFAEEVRMMSPMG